MLSQKSSTNLILLLAIAAFLIPTIWIESEILHATHGGIAYPLDESFLQMTIAKNLAFDHVWGITKYSFISASSSPLYTLLLALVFLVTGAHLLVPLLLNGLIAILFLRALQRWLIRQSWPAFPRLMVLLAVIFLIPLPLLVISGMEYTLQLFFSFLFIAQFSGAVADGSASVLPRKVFVYGLLMVTTSYESILILLMAAVVLLTRRQWWEAFKLLFLSLLPLYLFGLASVIKNNYFVPNPILLDCGLPSLKNAWQGLSFVLTITLLCFLIFSILRQKSKNPWRRYSLLVIPAALLLFQSITGFSHVRLSFWSDRSRIMDLAGVGDLDILQHIRAHSWTPALADSFAERSDVKIAVLHHSWSDKDTDPYWYKIASWQTPNDSVSFYSIDWRGVDQLQKTLHAYEPRLPSGVTVHYYPATRYTPVPLVPDPG
jgi:hypothetical protein